MPWPVLHDLEGAAQFMANAIAYEPLEDELHPPEHLLSPMSTISFQAGDAFDMATLLASVLIGAGFDAYVVMGYAPPAVVQNNQTGEVCPLLEAEAAAKESGADADAAAGSAPGAPQTAAASAGGITGGTSGGAQAPGESDYKCAPAILSERIVHTELPASRCQLLNASP